MVGQGSPPVARVLPLLALGGFYFALAAVSLLMTRLDGGVALLWIATALLMSWLSVNPVDRWPPAIVVCSIGGITSSALFGIGPAAALPLTCVGMAEAVGTVVLLRRWIGHARYFESAENIAIFVIVAGAFTPILSAFPAATIASGLTGNGYWAIWMQWVKAHALGMICFAPIFMLGLRGELRRSFAESTPAQRLECVALLAAVAIVTFGVFYQTRMPMLFLPILPMMAATVRSGRFGAAGSVIIVMVVGGVLARMGLGPVHLIHGTDGDRLQFFQFYIAVTMLLVMPVAALLKHRQELMARVVDGESRYRLLADNASDAVFNIAVDGTILYASPSVEDIGGYTPEQVTGSSAWAMIHEEDIDRVVAAHERALASPGQTLTVEYRARTKLADHGWFETKTRAVLNTAGEPIGVVSAVRDVSERKKLELALELARARAEGAAAAKSAFLANMSHEIRTPMNGVIGFTDLLLGSGLTREQRRQVELIADSGRAMMRLLNDILDISKVEAGQMKVHEEAFDLPHAVRACIKLVTPVAEQKKLRVEAIIAKGVPQYVRGDGLRLRQILLNLLGNGVKFTETGSVVVDVRTAERGEGIILEIRDTGIGIAPERQAAVFEHFVQADSSVAPRFGGTGLGLSISLRLAQLMGGDLHMESQLGKGTSFFLTLPLKATLETPRKATTLAQPALPAESAAAGRVLVVEDHDINQMLIATMLRQLGYPFEIAGDGAAGIAEIARGIDAGDPYTLVLMDMQMPRLDGIEATRRIRDSGIDAEMLPIVALTANAFADDAEACFAAGMQAHLVKPVKLDELSAVLRRWMPEQAIWQPTPVAADPASPDMDGLHERYRRRRDDALAMLDEMVRTGRFEDAALETLADAMHKLAGTAGMFGEAQIGAHAIAIEDGIENWPRAELPERIAAEYEALKKSA